MLTRAGCLQEIPTIVIQLANFWCFGKLVAEERWLLTWGGHNRGFDCTNSFCHPWKTNLLISCEELEFDIYVYQFFIYMNMVMTFIFLSMKLMFFSVAFVWFHYTTYFNVDCNIWSMTYCWSPTVDKFTDKYVHCCIFTICNK